MFRRPAFMLCKFVGWTAILCSSSTLFCQTTSVKTEDPATTETTYTPHMTFDVASFFRICLKIIFAAIGAEDDGWCKQKS